jgi:hypothetical protein
MGTIRRQSRSSFSQVIQKPILLVSFHKLQTQVYGVNESEDIPAWVLREASVFGWIMSYDFIN